MGKLIRCEADVTISKTVVVEFEDDEILCIEDQVYDAVRDALGLDFDDDSDLQIQERRLSSLIPE